MRLGTSLCLAMLACWPYAAYGQQQPPPVQEAEWTVMAWMNGDNDLQDYIVNDWKEMAWVGSGDAVNIVVQLDQKDKDDTYTFRVASEKDNDPVLQSAARITEANMVSAAELAVFIAEARKRYPAKRYALLFSSHGTGWREFKIAQPPGTPAAAAEAVPLDDDEDDESEIPPPPRFLPGGLFGSPNRSVSSDDNSPGDALYNVEIADALAHGMGGKPLDLVVFDACLMGMVEVAFGLRKAGRVLVASEELVSGHGFNHSTWVRQLRDNPAIDGAALGKLLVRSYDLVHTRRLDPGRTLSAFDLGVAGELARGVSALSEALIADIEGQRRAIRTARRNCAVYAAKGCDFGARDCVFHVDLKRFTDELARLTTSEEIRDLATRVGTVLQKGIIDNYAGPERRAAHGSSGLAIYFPAQPNDFLHDHLQQKAYLKANRDFPVEFVSKATWADFLHVYHLGTREATPCPEP
jgi:hypothetical protein